MADDDFSFLTDSDDDRAVEDVLSKAMDHSVLEQIASINCSSLSSSDNLPSHLETRFRKLKSLPAPTYRFSPSKSKSSETLDQTLPEFRNSSSNVDAKKCLDSIPTADSPMEPFDPKTGEKRGLNSRSPSIEDPNFEVFKAEKRGLTSKSETGLSGSPFDSWSSDSDSESRRRIGCFWCSPKEKRKKGKGNRLSSSSSYDDVFSELGTFSTKEQKKIMKRGMKEEEKINREAEKIVRWAKQRSARMMDVSELDDELSDLDEKRQ